MGYYDNDEDYNYIFTVAEMVGFSTIIQKATTSYSNDYKKIVGSFIAPANDLYFEITGKPSRAGTIGRLVNVTTEWKYASTPDCWHLAFDDRKNIVKFDFWSLKHLPNHTGPTVYNYIQKKAEVHAPAPPITNKFGQTFEVGDLVIAIGGTKGYASIVLGYVTRWTDAQTLFLKPYGPFGSITNSKKGDIRIRDANETIIVPEGADLESDLFTIVIGSDYK